MSHAKVGYISLLPYLTLLLSSRPLPNLTFWPKTGADGAIYPELSLMMHRVSSGSNKRKSPLNSGLD